MSDYEQGSFLTVAEVVADLEAAIALALTQRNSDDDSHILVPIWQLKVLMDCHRPVTPSRMTQRADW